MKRIYLILLGAISFTILAGGCVTRERVVYTQPGGPPVGPGEVVVADAPPPPVVESVSVSPGPGYVWVGGSWGWHRRHWAWERGHWVRPPHRGAVWVPHRYVYRNGVHVYVRGGWH